MNILVTGGAGYIGKSFINKFYKKFEKIFVIDNLYDSFNKNFPENVIFFKSDFGKKDILSNVFENQIECVFHFAAFARIGESNSNPSPFFENNVTQMISLLDIMKNSNCKKIIFSSSAAIFGNPINIPINENHPKNPINSYGETKLIGEKILEWYYKAYGIKNISLRYFNVAGSYKVLGENRKTETHILPLIFNSIIKQKPFYIFGNNYNTKDGTCIRDYIHIEDLIDAHMLAFKKLDTIPFDFFNLGSERGVSNLELVQLTSDLTGKDLKFDYKEKRYGDPSQLIASSEKAKKVLNWKNKNSINDIILSLIKYYKI
jgi:UDP-glucose 4-epimerase